MALSDSCSDEIYAISSEIANYADWEYHPSQLTHIFDALYSLALFVVRQDNYQNLPDSELRLISGKIILSTILNIKTEGLDNHLFKLIADTSKVNKNLSVIIDEVYNDIIISSDELKEDYPEILYKIAEIIKLREAQ